MRRPRRARGDAIAACVVCAAALLGCAAPAPAPVRQPTARDVPLANPGFEAQPSSAGRLQGWVPIQHASADSYAFTLDPDVRRSGSRSLRIASIGSEPYGSIVQKVSDASLRGRTVRFSGWLRTQDASRGNAGGGALIVQAMRGGTPIAYDHMRAASVKGTTDWRSYEIVLAIPDNADEVEIGAMLVGPGTLWFDDAKLEILPP